MTMESRQIAEVRRHSIDDDQRKVTFVLSTNDVDRHGTVVNQDNWKFSEPIPLGYQHDIHGNACEKGDPDDVIGSLQNLRVESLGGERKALLGDAFFEDLENDRNENADKIFNKLKKGTLTAGSVGFIPIGTGHFGKENSRGEIENEDVFYFDGQELLEFSVVNIPSNPAAQAKSLRNSLSRAIPYLKNALGSEYSYSDIEQMKVGEILDKIEGRDTKGSPTPEKREVPDVVDSPKAPKEREWTAEDAEQRVREWASSDGSGDKETINWDKYFQAFAYRDGNDPQNFTSYKLPHHDVIDGELHVVWNGVVAAAAVMEGAMGGADVPSDEEDDIKRHLGAHYEQFGETPPWEEEEGEENNYDDGRLELMQKSLDLKRKQS